MKHFLLLSLIFVGILSSSCVDKDYDISKVTTDDVTIGDETSDFRIPLANVTISMKEVGNSDTDIRAIFEEADTWLPSPLPDNSTYVDITALTPGSAYTDRMLTTLIAQLQTDDRKLTDVTDLVWNKYSAVFLPLLHLPGTPDKELFKTAFKTAFLANASIREEARKVAQSYLIDLSVDDLRYTIDRIDISDEVVDMLAKNLDPAGTPNPKNTLHLYGEIASALPVGLSLSPSFTQTSVRFTVNVEPDKAGTIAETQLFETDLRQIVRGTEIVIPVSLQKYYPGKGFSDDQQIKLTLRLHKRGGLKLDL